MALRRSTATHAAWRACLVVIGLVLRLGIAAADDSGTDSSRAAPPDTSRIAPRDTSRVTAADTSLAAPADTTLGGYLHSLSDSTNAYFGVLTLPGDTTGVDSIRAYALAHPKWQGTHARQRVTFIPQFTFNRVDGPVYSLGAAIGHDERPWGRIRGDLAWAAGPNLPLGGLRYARALEMGAYQWTLKMSVGRRTAIMDREATDRLLSSLRAFLNGSDHKHYLQRDGLTSELGFGTEFARLSVGYRDQLEQARSTTATWNLLHRTPNIITNIPATRGHVHEFEWFAQGRIPRTPFSIQVVHQTSSRGAGSDFEYRRQLFSAGANVGLGRTFAFVPQAAYGWVSGNAMPQNSFYLGGAHTLRSITSESIGGTRIAIARGEIVCVRDVLAALRLPHPAALPVQLAAFTGTGAAWGKDPYGSFRRSGAGWPEPGDWHSEVGFSLIYQPGIPEPLQTIRINFAVPIGGQSHGYAVSLGSSTALDLLRPLQ